MKKLTTLLLAVCLVLTLAVFMVNAEETETTNNEIWHGLQVINNASKPRNALTFTLLNVKAENELKVELWSGEIQLSTTVLRETDRDDETVKLYPAEAAQMTVAIVIDGVESGSWDTEWIMPLTTANLPDTIKVYVDGSAEPVDTLHTEGGVFINDTFKNAYLALDAVEEPSNVIWHGLQVINNASKPRNAVTFTLLNVKAENELKVELWSGETQLSTTVLRETDRDDETVKLYPAEAAQMTVAIVIDGVESGSWDTIWYTDLLSTNIPDTIKVYADGSAYPVDVLTIAGGVFISEDFKEAYLGLDAVRTVYDITCESSVQGSIYADLTAPEGDTVYVNVNLAYGYKFVKLVVTAANGEPVEVSGTSFVMPSSDVTVSAIYEEAYPTPEKLNLKATVKADELKAREYKFELSYIVDGKTEVIEVAKNDANGNINFATIIFNGAGNYTFYIKQIAGDNASVEYDATVYAINVKVVYTLDGELVATVTGDAAAFTNVAK